MKRYLFITLFILAACISLQAKPAYRGPIIRTQADGSQITTYMRGDEHFHYMIDEQGNWLKLNNGMYEQTRSLSTNEILKKRMNSPKMQYMQQRTETAYPLNLAKRGLIIMATFADTDFQSENTQAAFQEMLDGDHYTYNGAYGSCKKYFTDQSMGKYVPIFDVVGPVRLSKKMKYYGENDYQGYDKHPAEMVKEACELADSLFKVDYTLYDNDNDGYVDWVYVIYSGYGEADGADENTIWPHTFGLSGENLTLKLDGKWVEDYACSSELAYTSKKRDGISTICHEFTHVLGFPDVYATNDANHKTSGRWDIMDYGPYNDDGITPPSYSAYERYFMGWLTPVLLNSTQHLTLEEIQNSNAAYIVTTSGNVTRMKGNDPLPVSFFMIENRQNEGWDKYLPGHGMIVTQVNYSYSAWYDNTVNNNSNLLGIDIIEADGKIPSYKQNNPNNGYFGKPGDAFPTGDTSYSFSANYSFANVVETDEHIIEFDFNPQQAAIEEAEVDKDEKIVNIYTMFGQILPASAYSSLEHGVYIIETESEYKTIVR